MDLLMKNLNSFISSMQTRPRQLKWQLHLPPFLKERKVLSRRLFSFQTLILSSELEKRFFGAERPSAFLYIQLFLHRKIERKMQ